MFDFNKPVRRPNNHSDTSNGCRINASLFRVQQLCDNSDM